MASLTNSKLTARFGHSILASLFLLGAVNSLPAQTPPPRPVMRQNYPTPPTNSAYSGAASTVATTTSMAVLDNTRKLGIGDQVSFRVVEDRDPPVQLLITDSGEMEVPYIGRVKAAGRSCKELATAIKSSLEVDYYYRATVIVALDAISTATRGRITVSGEVLTQGSQEIPATVDFTASKAIANAGGPTRFGDTRRVKIIRQSGNGAPSIIIFDYKKFLDAKGEDILLQPNDTINVPARGVTFF